WPQWRLVIVLKVTAGIPQLSVTVGSSNVQPLPASMVLLAAQVICGFSVSLIVTVNVQALLLPWLSVAVFVTTVTPIGKMLPLAGTLTTFTGPQLSFAVTTNVTLLRLHWPASVDNARFAGQTICGISVSLIVTVNVQM